ncbi:MAG: hypothetical protein ABSH47_13725 [Bryobacteraceae bacterium]|jgi:hypothetical protein
METPTDNGCHRAEPCGRLVVASTVCDIVGALPLITFFWLRFPKPSHTNSWPHALLLVSALMSRLSESQVYCTVSPETVGDAMRRLNYRERRAVAAEPD